MAPVSRMYVIGNNLASSLPVDTGMVFGPSVSGYAGPIVCWLQTASHTADTHVSLQPLYVVFAVHPCCGSTDAVSK